MAWTWLSGGLVTMDTGALEIGGAWLDAGCWRRPSPVVAGDGSWRMEEGRGGW